MPIDNDSEPDYAPGSEKMHYFFPTAPSDMVINYHQLEHKGTSVHNHCDHHGDLRKWDVEANSHDHKQVRCLPSPLPTYNPRHLMARPFDIIMNR